MQAGSPQICGNCGVINAPGDSFCSNCGYTLTGQPTHYPTIQGTGNMPTVLSTSSSTTRRQTGALLAGNMLGGRYRIVELVGRGGFGAVYKATDEHFQSRHTVAVKEMSDASISPQQRAQAINDFRNEARLLVDLQHQNLPHVSDFFEEGNKAYLVMDFVQGKTLETLQDEAGGPLHERQVMGWALQLCIVLNYLHTHQPPIIFRDMKPSNVMLATDGQIKLIDFGIARVFKATGTKDTTLLGSRGYAPLEQYGRGQSDGRSDIYALGATLYDLLSKEVPADAPARSISPQIFVPPRQINRQLSSAAETIVLKAMMIKPEDRYQSALDMYQAIIASGIAGTTTSGTQFPTFSAAGTTNTIQNQSGQMATQLGQSAQATQVSLHGAGTPPQASSISRRSLLIGASGVAGLVVLGGAGAVYYASHLPSAGNKATGTISVNFIYSTEKEQWIQQAIKDFNQQSSPPRINGKQVQIIATGLGSVDAKNQIVSESLKPMPVAWSPASFLELNQLTTDWSQKHTQGLIFSSGDYEVKSLVFSPLVFGIWENRAQILKNKYGTIDWTNIHKAILLNSWGDIPGGNSAWGPVKLGQTRPDQSNSGLLSITLQAYSYYALQRDLTISQVKNAGFLSFFSDLEGAVQTFGESSGTYLTHSVLQEGPAAYDIIPIYENLILTNSQGAQAQWGRLQPIYPKVTILSDHPFAILQGSWASTEQQEAAKLFRDFLLSPQAQRQAVLDGFRPTSTQVSIQDKINNNPFLNQPANFRIPGDILDEAQPPAGAVVDELLNQWLNRYQSMPTID